MKTLQTGFAISVLTVLQGIAHAQSTYSSSMSAVGGVYAGPAQRYATCYLFNDTAFLLGIYPEILNEQGQAATYLADSCDFWTKHNELGPGQSCSVTVSIQNDVAYACRWFYLTGDGLCGAPPYQPCPNLTGVHGTFDIRDQKHNVMISLPLSP
jgi:hypothetical protein